MYIFDKIKSLFSCKIDMYFDKLEGAEIVDVVIDGVLVQVEKTMAVETMKQYLTDTEWVESYYTKHLTGVELIPTESSKWSIIDVRKQYKLQLRSM